jgi:hypothetical protein
MFEGVLPFPPLSKLQASSLRAKVPVYNSQLSKPIYSIVAFEPTSRFLVAFEPTSRFPRPPRPRVSPSPRLRVSPSPCHGVIFYSVDELWDDLQKRGGVDDQAGNPVFLQGFGIEV